MVGYRPGPPLHVPLRNGIAVAAAEPRPGADPAATPKIRGAADGHPGLTVLYASHIMLYDNWMASMNISAARENLHAAVELSRTEAVFLERYGHPAAVLVSPERYDELMTALEDAQDVAAFDAAMDEGGPNIPWEQVKADLGWT